MLTLTHQRINTVKVFKTYDDLYAYLTAFEKARPPVEAGTRIKGWIITRYGRHLIDVGPYESQSGQETGESAALASFQELLEDPLFQGLAPETVAAWKESWCRAYCAAHGYLLEETPSSPEE